MPSKAATAAQAAAAGTAPGDPPQTPKQQRGSATRLPSLVETAVSQPGAGKGTGKARGPAPKGAVRAERREEMQRVAVAEVYCSAYPAYSGGSYGQGAHVSYNKGIWWARMTVPAGKPPGSGDYMDRDGDGTYFYEPYWTHWTSCLDNPPDPEYPPSLTAVFPLVGMLVGTRTPLLGAQASSVKGSALRYAFTVCTDEALSTGCVSSGARDGNTWRIPSGSKLAWSTQYWWRVSVTDTGNNLTTTWSEGTFTTGVRQPQTGSLFSTPSPDGQEFQPATGNYTTSATDAVVASAGPPLSVTRTYNSLDPRRSGMFGAGWSTRWDAKLEVEHAGAVQITFPDGRQVRFAPDDGGAGTFQPPPGMYATLKALDVPSCIPENPHCDFSGVPAWQLMDKASTSHFFNQSGQLIKVVDPRGRTQALEYGTDGKLAKVSSAGGRHLSFTWTGDHVTQVATNPVNGTPLRWSYTYSGDTLTSACAPGTVPACTTYTTTPGSQYYSAIRNSDPLGYWRLGETTGTKAADSGAGAGEATYDNVTLSQNGAVEASTDKAAQFTGTSALRLQDYAVSQLQDAASVEAWFKTTQAGVIMSSDAGGVPATEPPAPARSRAGRLARSAIYVGSDGKLRGQFRPTTGAAAIAPITSAGAVNDGQWHHVVLTLAGTRQELFLDGHSVGTTTGSGLGGWPIGAMFGSGGLEGGAWPGGPSATQELGLVGLLDEVALYDKPLTAQDVTVHYAARAAAPHLMAKITLPSGRVHMQAAYDTATDRVKTYTDANGGPWQVSAPVEDKKKGASTVTVTDPAAGTIVYGHDGWRGLRLTTRTDQLGKKTTYSYDTAGYPTKVTDPNSNTIERAFDKRGNVLATTTCRTADSCQTSQQEYYLNASNVVDPRNDRVTKTRDARSTSATDNTYATTLDYNEYGEQTKQTTPATADFPNGRAKTIIYTDGTEPASGGSTTPAGLPKTTTDPRGNSWHYTYTATGDLAEQKDPAGLITKLTYDTLGRPTSRTLVTAAHPQGATTTFTYDPLGRPLTQTDPAVKNEVSGVTHTSQLTLTYDADGNQLSQSLIDLTGSDASRTVTNTYDGHGRPATTTDPEGGVSRQTWNSLGRLATTADARGTVVEHVYSKRGELITKTLKGWIGSPASPQPARDVVLESFSYDPVGRLTTQADAMGRKTSFTYYGDNQPKQKIADDVKLNGTATARDVVMEEHTYDPAGNRSTLVTAGTTTEFVYDAAGRLISQTLDPAGIKRKTSFVHDANDNVTKTTQTGAGTTRAEIKEYGYTPDNQVNREMVDNGDADVVSTLTFDERGLVTAVTDPRGNAPGSDAASFTTALRYDLAGRLVEKIAPPVTVDRAGATATARPTTLTGYNAAGQPTHQRDAEGHTSTTVFDRAGRPTGVSMPSYTPPGGQALTPKTTKVYDAAGQVVRVIDPRGATTGFAYDQLGRQVQKTEPAAVATGAAAQAGNWVTEYDLAGEPLASVDPLGARTEATYDDLGRPITATQVERQPQPAAFTTKLEYNDAGRLTKSTDPKGKATTYTVNAAGEVTSVTDPLANKTLTDYDLAGRTVKITNPLGNASTAEYDLAGRKIAVKDLDAAATVLRTFGFGYDPAGNQTSATSPQGHITRQSFDALNRVTALIEPTSATEQVTTRFGYDAAGARTRLTDGRGHTTWTTYNPLGLPESVTEPATTAHPNAADRTWTTAYDATGNPVTTLQPGGVRIDRTFDPLNRLVKESGAGGGAASAERLLSYDLAGRTTLLNDLRIAYNDRGQPFSVSKRPRPPGGPGGTPVEDPLFTTTYAYDALGKPTERTDPAGSATFTWDAAGRLATATDPVTNRTLTYGYDAASRLKTLTGKTSAGTAADTQIFAYDNLDRLTSHTLKGGAATQLAKITYGWDTDDNLTTKTLDGLAGAGAHTYGYDGAGRLTSWKAPDGTTTGYAWDAAGNRTQAGDKTFTYDERNRLTTGDGTTYTYTARGTLASRTTAGAITNLTFDAFDRLIADGDSLYSYDALDRLTQRIRGTTTQQYTYSGLSNDLAAIVHGGAAQATYGRSASGELLGLREGAAPASSAMTDLHTDLIATFSPTAVTGSTGYGPFGEPLARSGIQAALGYQGEYTDPDTGNVNMHARWYQPSTATFTSRDTTTLNPSPSIQANRYTYANAGPLTGTDPTGHNTEWTSGSWNSSGGDVWGGSGTPIGPRPGQVVIGTPAFEGLIGAGTGNFRGGNGNGCIDPSASICVETYGHAQWWSAYINSPEHILSQPDFDPAEAARIGVIDTGLGKGRPAPSGYWSDSAEKRQIFADLYLPGRDQKDVENSWKSLKLISKKTSLYSWENGWQVRRVKADNDTFYYRFHYMIGPRNGRTPGDVGRWIAKNFDKAFPFGGCGPTLEAGERCDLTNVPYWGTVLGKKAPIRVTAVRHAGFEFEALDGHFDPTGSIVNFRIVTGGPRKAYGPGKYLWLVVTAWAPAEWLQNGSPIPWVNAFMARDTWPYFARNIQRYMPPGDPNKW